MFTVTQVSKSDRFSIYCSVNVPFSKRSIEIDLALSNVNANRSFLDRFKNRSKCKHGQIYNDKIEVVCFVIEFR